MHARVCDADFIFRRCSDNNGLPPMKIQCAFAFRGTAAARQQQKQSSSPPGEDDGPAAIMSASQAVFDVVFQQRSTADYMTCRMTQISVQSVRWPATRFSSR